MTLRYSREARQRIRSLPPETKRGLNALLSGLVEDPYAGKPLQRELEGFWSIAYKRYRVIYRIVSPQKEIRVYLIGPRRHIYEEIQKAREVTP